MPLLQLEPDYSLHYHLIAGPPARPYLVFLHEGLGSVSQWRDFPQRLCNATDCPGLVYDRLGHGRSSPLRHPRTIHFMHEYALCELPRLLAALLPERPYLLVGHSDGGSIALIHGAARPPGLIGIITEAAHVVVDDLTLAGITAAEQAFAAGRLNGLTRYHGNKTESMFTAWSRAWLDPAFRFWSIEYLLPAIQVPLLVLQGRDDQYGTPAQVERIVSGAGGAATPVLLEGCGHSPHLELPELTLDHMAAFVTRIAG